MDSTVGLKPYTAQYFFVSHRLWELGQASHIYPETFGTGPWRQLVQKRDPLISVVILH